MFQHLKPLLSKRGVIFGTTILGQGVQHNPLAKLHLKLYNSRKIFSNTSDSLEALEEILKKHFQKYNLKVVGGVAFFVAWQFPNPITPEKVTGFRNQKLGG